MPKKNNNPNKGFLKQLAVVNEAKPQIKQNLPFDYSKPVVKPEKRMSLGTPKDGEKLKKSVTPESTFIAETQNFIKDRREK